MYWYDGTENMLNAALSLKVSGGYIWHTMRDEEVRHAHARREGHIFYLENPPPGGHPGEEYGCRCWMEPLWDAKESIVNTLRKWRQEQEFLTQTLITPIKDSKTIWGTVHFGWHFGTGGGRNVTLSETGHLHNIIAISEKYIYEPIPLFALTRWKVLIIKGF